MATESIYPAPFDTSTFIFPAEWQALSDVFGGSATGLLFLRDGMIVHLNNSLEEQLGFEDAELIGQPVEVLLLPDAKSDSHLDETSGDAGCVQEGTVRLKSKSGEPVEFHLIRNRIDTLSNARYTIWVLQPPSKQPAVEAVHENAAATPRRDAIAAHLSDLVLVCAPDTTLRYASHSVAGMLGVDDDTAQNLRLIDVVHKDDHSRLLASFDRLAANIAEPSTITFRVRHRDGSWRHIEVQASNLLAHPDIGGLLLSGRDVTDHIVQQRNIDANKKKQLHYLNRLLHIARNPHPDLASALKVILKSSAKALGTHRCAYWETNGDPSVTHCILAYDDVAQNFVDEAPDARFAVVLHPLLRHVLSSDRALVVSDVDQDPRSALSCEYFHATGIKAMMIVPVRHAGGVAGLLTLSHFAQSRSWDREEADFAGNVAKLITLIFNEVERTRTAAQLRNLAHHEGRTGLPSRQLQPEDANQVLAKAAENAAPLAAFFIGFDGAGQAGDEILEAAASRLTSVVRKDDILLRLGSDEFMLLARKVEDSRIANDIAQQILEAMQDPFSLHGEEQWIDARVGIARYPQDGADIEALRTGCQRSVSNAGLEARHAH
jgi:diguanylate cyclase (GGDEF)-like protein/PAS domain S-box-containing protein